MAIYFKLSPELSDGQNNQITDKQGVVDAIKAWVEDIADSPSEYCNIETVEMSDEEFEKLPLL